MKRLTGNVFVSGQIQITDLEIIAAQGIKTVINNRPDGEMMGQPLGVDLENAARALGLNYVSLPMAGGVSHDLVEGAIEAYSKGETPILAFCGSGTRSTALWCFANVQTLGVDGVLKVAADAGYQLEQLRVPLGTLAN